MPGNDPVRLSPNARALETGCIRDLERSSKAGGTSALRDDLSQQLLGVGFIPLRKILTGSNLDPGGLGVLPLDVNRNVKVAFLSLELALVTALFHAGGVGNDSFVVHDLPGMGRNLIGRARDHGLGAAGGQINAGTSTGARSSRETSGGREDQCQCQSPLG